MHSCTALPDLTLQGLVGLQLKGQQLQDSMHHPHLHTNLYMVPDLKLKILNQNNIPEQNKPLKMRRSKIDLTEPLFCLFTGNSRCRQCCLIGWLAQGAIG